MKRTLAILLALVMVLAVAACTPTTPANPDGGNNAPEGGELAGTYDILVWTGEDAVELTKQQIENFNNTNEYGIKFVATVNPVSEATSADQMLVDVSVGADIYCFAQDQFVRLVQGGALAKLSDESAAVVKAANDPGVVAAATAGDAMYAYPMTSDNGYFMYYDKTVIPEEDVDSLEKLIADCEAANKYFAFETNTSAWYLASWFFATGCKSEWTVADDGKTFVSVLDTFNSPEGLIAAKGLKKFVDSPMALSSSSGDEFASDAAIVVTGTWSYEAIKNLLGDNMGVTDLPSFEVDGKEYHLGSFNGCKLMGVKPQTDAMRLVVLELLAEYLTDETRQMERFDALSWGPSNLNAQKSDAVQNNPGLAALLKQNEYSIPQGQIHGSWWDIAKVIADDVKAATDEDGLKAALQNYYDKISALFTMTEEQKTAWGVIGAICGTNWDTDFPMTETEAGVFVSEPLELKAGDEFKVRQGASWDVNYGVNCEPNGANIVVPADDTYTVTLDTNNMTLTFVNAEGVLPEAAPVEGEGEGEGEAEATEDTWALIGTLCGTNWDTDIPMFNKDGKWIATVTLHAGEEFKVRANGAWDLNYGVTGEETVAGGDNIVVPEGKDGAYVVILDLTGEAAKLTVTQSGWSAIGTIGGTNWDTDFFMTEVEPGVFTTDVVLCGAGEEYKVRADATWDVNYGITDGALLFDGANVKIEADGNYVITLDFNTMTLTAVAQ